jgi:hypothetical protein
MKEFKIDAENSINYDDKSWHLAKRGIIDNDRPSHLFKYYSLSEFSIDSLQNNYFYLNNPLNFNDPFDCCNNLIIEKQKDAIDGLPVPFINDAPHVGISCFSTNGLNPLMWGHYTNSYVGFVIKFRNNFNFQTDSRIKYYKLNKVVYSDNPTPATEKLPFSEDYQFMVKLRDWQYEK